MNRTAIKNPSWWVILYIALAIGLRVVASKSMLNNISDTTTVKVKRDDICWTQGCIRSVKMILRNRDSRVDPCDNFYKYACGKFLAYHRPGNSFSTVREKLQEQLKTSISADITFNEPKSFRLVKILYKACMNTKARGPELLLKILKKCGGWPVLDQDAWNETDFDWKNLTYKLHDAGYFVNYLLYIFVDVDKKNSTKNVIYLDQAYFDLLREDLLKGMDDETGQAYKYYEHMVHVAVMLGANKTRAKKELKESLQFEMKIANITLPDEKRRDMNQLYNPMTIKNMSMSYPSIPWKEYFRRFFPPSIIIEEDEIVIVVEPSYIIELEKLINETPKRIQANYLMWRAVKASLPYLNDDGLKEKSGNNSTVLNGQTDRPSRSPKCIAFVYRVMSSSIAAMYVRHYFDKAAKGTAVEMVMGIKQQFTKILKKIDWMDEGTRQNALEKVAAMTSHIGYPDELLDDNKLEPIFENLELSADNYLEDILNLMLFDNEYSFSQLRKPVNKTSWINYAESAVVNVFYYLTQNSIEFPAGILQDPFFSNDRPKYMNYGAIGYFLGREIIHGFDNEGRQYDKNGNLVNWWAPSTEKKFLERVNCIINQYGNYTVDEVGLNLNGIITQNENIADNGGIKLAYLAYLDWVEKHGNEKILPVIDRTPKQLFWISTANMLCSKYQPGKLKFELRYNSFSPEEYRVNGPLSNMPEFAKDFNCPVGSKMNPKKKCSVW